MTRAVRYLAGLAGSGATAATLRPPRRPIGQRSQTARGLPGDTAAGPFGEHVSSLEGAAGLFEHVQEHPATRSLVAQFPGEDAAGGPAAGRSAARGPRPPVGPATSESLASAGAPTRSKVPSAPLSPAIAPPSRKTAPPPAAATPPPTTGAPPPAAATPPPRKTAPPPDAATPPPAAGAPLHALGRFASDPPHAALRARAALPPGVGSPGETPGPPRPPAIAASAPGRGPVPGSLGASWLNAPWGAPVAPPPTIEAGADSAGAVRNPDTGAPSTARAHAPVAQTSGQATPATATLAPTPTVGAHADRSQADRDGARRPRVSVGTIEVTVEAPRSERRDRQGASPAKPAPVRPRPASELSSRVSGNRLREGRRRWYGTAQG